MPILPFLKKIIPLRFFMALQLPYHFLLAFSAALWFWFPSRKLFVIGITGTKGKTTVVELIHEILQAGGEKTASVSSLRFRVGGDTEINEKKITMPGRFFLQRFLHRAVKSGCRYVVLEVTSEGIKQFRHRFINFSAAVMTNMEREHIESHGSFERYLRAKLDLFWRLPMSAVAVINRHDPYMDRFCAATGARKIFHWKKYPRRWRTFPVFREGWNLCRKSHLWWWLIMRIRLNPLKMFMHFLRN